MAACISVHTAHSQALAVSFGIQIFITEAELIHSNDSDENRFLRFLHEFRNFTGYWSAAVIQATLERIKMLPMTLFHACGLAGRLPRPRPEQHLIPSCLSSNTRWRPGVDQWCLCPLWRISVSLGGRLPTLINTWSTSQTSRSPGVVGISSSSRPTNLMSSIEPWRRGDRHPECIHIRISQEPILMSLLVGSIFATCEAFTELSHQPVNWTEICLNQGLKCFTHLGQLYPQAILISLKAEKLEIMCILI